MDPRVHDSAPSLTGVIARSRSRYKGNRPGRGHTAAHLFTNNGTEQSQPAEDCKIPRPQLSNKKIRETYMGDLKTSTTAQAVVHGKEQHVPASISGPADNGKFYSTDKDVEFAKTQYARLRKTASTKSPCEQRRVSAKDINITHKAQPLSKALAYEDRTFRDGTSRLQRSTDTDDAQQSNDPRSHGRRLHKQDCSHTGESKHRRPDEGDTMAYRRPLALREKSPTRQAAGSGSANRGSDSRDDLKRTISAPISGDPKAAARPAFDAPISAVNSGERTVKVKYDRSVISINITPSTTPVDIISAANAQLSGAFDPGDVVLLESFRQLGLERPLRGYEHIREIMNSWANDTQNTLIIVPSPTGGRDDDLNIQCVLKQQPEDTSVHIYHSQRPGAWDKRWVTLRADGQVIAAKRDGAINLCHLSDFDIYVPTVRQLSKKTRPPKKLCFAIKSQQKSSMFLTTVTFVHFFSTNDKTLAARWYKAVQEWRSWYLVHVMGKGKKEEKSVQPLIANDDQRRLSDSPKQDSRPIEGLVFDSESERVEQYKARLCTPRSQNMDMKQSESDLKITLPRCGRIQPLASFPKGLTKDGYPDASKALKEGPSLTQTKSAQQADSDPFVVTGLLGRTYTRRKKAQHEGDGCSGIGGESTSPVLELTKTNLAKSLSQRPKQKPLVDLTLQSHGPPRSSRGRDIKPIELTERGLVEAATNSDQAIPTLPATAWQEHIEPQPISRRSGTVHGPSMLPESTPFTTGLLASSSQGQGDTGHGKGVMTSDRIAEVPMIGLNERSKYTPGSLLANVKRYPCVTGGTVIEREKTRELDVAVGEGR